MECLLICLGIYFIQHMGSFNYGKIRTMGAVLVAISIPIFTSQLEKSRDAVSVSNIRAAYAEASAAYLTGSSGGNATISTTNKNIVTVSKVDFKGTQSGWSDLTTQLPFSGASGNNAVLTDDLGGSAGTHSLQFTFDSSNGACTLTAVDPT